MKIFNNFDTKLKAREYGETVKKHGKENVILIQRTFAFWVIHGVLPFVFFIGLFIASLFAYFKYIQNYTFFKYFYICIAIVYLLYVVVYLLNRYLDYKFDFTIITHEGVFTFKQLGIFNSKNKDFPASKIRSISSSREGLLGNIFGYGSIEIITDGSLTNRDEDGRHMGGKMIMTYVKNPNKLRKRLIDICLVRN